MGDLKALQTEYETLTSVGAPRTSFLPPIQRLWTPSRMVASAKGAAVVEYVLLAGLIAVVAILYVTDIGQSVSDIFQMGAGAFMPGGAGGPPNGAGPPGGVPTRSP